MKTFLGLPIYKTGIGYLAVLRHIGSVILFTGLGYFISAMLVGAISGDVWMFIQSVEKHLFIQALLLISGILLGLVMQTQLNKTDKRELKFFFHYPPIDKYLYTIGLVFTFLIINELFGL